MFWGFVKIMVLEAFFTHSTSPQPMTLSESVGYVWLGQGFLLAIVPWGGDKEIQEMIRSGAVGYDLLRPTDLYNFWFVRTLAMRTAPLVLRAIPLLCVAIFVIPLLGFPQWSLAFPQSFAAGIAFFLSFIGAMLLSCSITMLLTVSMMWTLSGEGVNSILPNLVNYFPLVAVLGKEDAFSIPVWFCYISPMAGILFLIAAIALWKIGERYYCSTGS